MNLLENESKSLLSQANIPTPLSALLKNDSTYTGNFPTVLKSQVPTGGRGKAGGIVIVNTPEEAQQATDKLFALNIKGHLPQTILAEEKLDIAK